MGSVAGCTTQSAESMPTEGPSAELSSLGHVGLNDSSLARRVDMSRQECKNANGEEVGDIGDGRIHQADYQCVNGETPLGSIKSDEDQPIASEGNVCCRKNR